MPIARPLLKYGRQKKLSWRKASVISATGPIKYQTKARTWYQEAT